KKELILLDPRKTEYEWQAARQVLSEIPEGHVSFVRALAKYKGDSEQEMLRREDCLNSLSDFLVIDSTSKKPQLPPFIPDSVITQSIAYLGRLGRAGGGGALKQVYLLGCLGPRAKDAIPLLKDLRDNSGDSRLREDAQAALVKIQQAKK